ncbi:MAG: UPF0182 family protein, partial [Deltaproteobacteria bacterium]|nr:UPF0182 family protein [Deltaproteobacteria bacterium]
WFRALGYERYFWLRLLYRYLIFIGFTLLFFSTFFLNFWIGSRYLGRVAPPAPSDQTMSRYRELVRHFRVGSLRVYLPFSFALAVLLSWPLYKKWEATLLYVFSHPAGFTDPYYGRDISFYLFNLPIYQLLLNEILLALVLLTTGLMFLYWIESRMLVLQEQPLPRGAKIHLSFLLFLLFFATAWKLWLQRYELLYFEDHSPLFYGPGFVEMRVVLPLIYMALVALIIMTLSLLYYIHTRRGKKLLVLSIIALVLIFGARYSQVLQDVVERYIVKPNEIARESTFIEKNIAATLRAYNLHEVETREFALDDSPWDDRAPQIQDSLRNIPVWDKEMLVDVFEQLQQLRTYYDFTMVHVDRYMVGDLKQQVFLASRELNLKNLPAGARNWVNERLKYTHGLGVVMVPAAQAGDEPMTWFIQGIPPASAYGFYSEEPSVYYGLANYGPAIAPNDSGEMGYPIGDTFTLVNYQGTGDVRMPGLFRKLIFALYFGEKDIFFTTKTNRDSRILFRRNIVERVRALTPFFILDKNPYIVVTPRGYYWIVDAYTISDRYPGSQPHNFGFNYVRNSVKIIIDAFNGTVDYYIYEPTDPIIQAYRSMYPGLLKDMAEMPEDLQPHVRYPKDLFDVQMGIYSKYHQTDVEIFYKQEDMWEFPAVEIGGKTVKMTPYYLTLNLIDSSRPDFLLLCPMVPKARPNLRSLAVVGSDRPYYGKIIVYSFPKGSLVYGPFQVDAMINQDTRVSEQFTLWNQMGSQVSRGKMIVLPVDGSIVYIQPVYLKAHAGLKIPQLKRLILTKGEIVVMERSLEEGFENLNKRFEAQKERARRRLMPLTPQTDEAPKKEEPRPEPEQ